MFDYRFDGSEYSIDIFARSPDEARAKLNALSFARFAGEVKALIPIPSVGLIGRIIRRVRAIYRDSQRLQ
jgi:hypothetical protein